ncbi:hypothetical protein [Bdellovibrio svalbardensis]|uniref:Lipoprotein n=1 Tax=Bdellovibrio svalbardensis TaxID=2972972 RepID=A0ABT6DDY9_9BACT|nr:hypothetical protein [Bdellovibrio svalbardensis]MDG0815054.1 hypothetical protein [Bdellovibrio svalbardensis]
MKVRFNKTTLRAFGAFVASGILVVSFQNCGKAGFDSSLDGELSSGAVDAALSAKYGSNVGSKVATIPFAFDGGFDQITYNSCAESTLAGNTAFFSLKAGAYETMGIKLTDDFFNYVSEANGFKPNYPATTISTAQYAEYLADSPINKDAIPNAAIRSRSNLFNVYSANTTVTLGSDVIGMVSNLTDSLVMDSVTTKSNSYTRYFPFSPDNRNVEATLYFNKDQGVAEGFRKVLIGDGVLSFTYLSSAADPNLIRGPSSASPAKTAYGKGYNLSFSRTNTYGNSPANVLTAITETNLQNGQGVAAWNCSRRYKVFRRADVASCPPLTDANMADAAVRRELDIARRQLRGDQWDINPILRCAIPKDNVSCYNEELVNGAPAGVEYTDGAACFNPLVQAGNYGGTIPVKRCANYITVCTRF